MYNIAEVMPPVINALSRSNERTAIVSFTVPPSEQDVEYFEILLYAAPSRDKFNDSEVYYHSSLLQCLFYLS